MTTRIVNQGVTSDAPDYEVTLPVDNDDALTNSELRAAPVPIAKGQQTVTDCTIASGQSLSPSVDLGVTRLVGITIPSTFEPGTLTFQASFDGTTWNNVFKDGSEVSVLVGVSRRIVLNPADFYGIRYLKVRGGTSGSATTVAAARTLKLISEA